MERADTFCIGLFLFPQASSTIKLSLRIIFFSSLLHIILYFASRKKISTFYGTEQIDL